MITDLPSPQDFYLAGTSYLNLAWTNSIGLALDYMETPFEDWDDTDQIPDEYWEASQPHLSVAVSLLQQGLEFLIKGRIVEVSPLLLIDGSSKSWPRQSDKKDTPFHRFKTVDAQELITIHDTTTESRFDEEFRELFEKVRKRRNTIMHSLDRSHRFTAVDILVDVLEASHTLLGEKKWFECRSDYHANEPGAILAGGIEDVAPYLAREALYIIRAMPRRHLLKYFGYDKSQRSYLCPSCNHSSAEWDLFVETAQLNPNTPASCTIYCFSCRELTDVIRSSCADAECPGNVMSEEYGQCLTCGDDY